jgi:branched-subunit amino acid transport protein
MIIWLMLIGIGAITYAIRLSFIVFFGQTEMPPRLLDILRLVPMTVLSAIILPQIFVPNNTIDISFGNPRWIAGSIAVLVAWRTRNVLITIAVGMLTLWGLQLIH